MAASEDMSQAKIRDGLVLGLFPDTNVIGWCVVDASRSEILGLGAHQFPSPTNPKSGTTLASERRAARSARVNRRRKGYRSSHVLALLRDAGLVPANAGAEWLQTRSGDVTLPRLRAEVLDRPASDRELAQVLYYLAMHKGYGTSDGEDMDKEGKKIKACISENALAMEGGGFRTIGELLRSRGVMRNGPGDYSCMASKQMVADEVRTILSLQRSMPGGNPRATEGLERGWLAVVGYARPTIERDRAVYGTVGRCTYFPDLPRAAKADPSCERLFALEALRHLRVVDDLGHRSALDARLVSDLMDQLFSCDPAARPVRYADVRRRLALPDSHHFAGIRRQDERREVFAPRAWRLLRESLGADLVRRLADDRELADAVCEALTFASSAPSLEIRLGELGVSLCGDELEELGSLPLGSKALNGYGDRSLRAVRILLDALEEPDVATLLDAERDTGLLPLRLSASSLAQPCSLPPYSQFDPTCKNPVVLRAVSRMRKVVIAVMRQFGMPQEIRIMLGRELGTSKKEKERISRNIRLHRKEREGDLAVAAEALGCSQDDVPPSTLTRVRLWRQQGELDPYTGAHIDLVRLCRDEGYAWVSHILPLSRTGDDGMRNKVLCLSSSALAKGPRSPWEWMHQEADAPDWEEFVARVGAMRDIEDAKKERLLEDDLDGRSPALIERNVNDGRYLAKAMRDYLDKCLVDAEGARPRVSAVARPAVDVLARTWGTGGEWVPYGDPRRRAAKAAIVAACDARTVRACASYGETRLFVPEESRQAILSGTEPWAGYYATARALAQACAPTRMVSRGLSGEALEMTNRRLVSVDPDTGYASLTGSDKLAGNYKVLPDGNVRMVSGMACLRLWHDPDAAPGRGRKGTGRYYAEPVYYDDVPKLSGPDYVPRTPVRGIARVKWPAVPESARRERPIILFPGEIVVSRGVAARYQGFMISTLGWTFVDPVTRERADGFPSVSSLCDQDGFRVVSEDVLGLELGSMLRELKRTRQ